MMVQLDILRWWNGRHVALKMLYRKMYEFESRLEDLEEVRQKSNLSHVQKSLCKFCSNRYWFTGHQVGQNITSFFSLGW